MKDLKTLLESSILDIDSQMEIGDKLENVSLTSILDSKSKEEFEMKFNVLRSIFESYHANKKVQYLKPRTTYIAFSENLLMNKNNTNYRTVVYFGTTKDLYRIIWNGTKPLFKECDNTWSGGIMAISKYNHLDVKIYECPNNIKKEVNKLITQNLI